MKKVAIEITSEGWETTVEINGKKFVEKHEIVQIGESQRISGDFEDEEDIPEELYNALNGFFEFDVMNALAEIE